MGYSSEMYILIFGLFHLTTEIHLSETVQRNGRLCRPSRRRKDDIEANFKERGSKAVDWIQLARVRPMETSRGISLSNKYRQCVDQLLKMTMLRGTLWTSTETYKEA
jgi:hypothetical protein